jgi:hypothetical protein
MFSILSEEDNAAFRTTLSVNVENGMIAVKRYFVLLSSDMLECSFIVMKPRISNIARFLFGYAIFIATVQLDKRCDKILFLVQPDMVIQYETGKATLKCMFPTGKIYTVNKVLELTDLRLARGSSSVLDTIVYRIRKIIENVMLMVCFSTGVNTSSMPIERHTRMDYLTDSCFILAFQKLLTALVEGMEK